MNFIDGWCVEYWLSDDSFHLRSFEEMIRADRRLIRSPSLTFPVVPTSDQRVLIAVVQTQEQAAEAARTLREWIGDAPGAPPWPLEVQENLAAALRHLAVSWTKASLQADEEDEEGLSN